MIDKVVLTEVTDVVTPEEETYPPNYNFAMESTWDEEEYSQGGGEGGGITIDDACGREFSAGDENGVLRITEATRIYPWRFYCGVMKSVESESVEIFTDASDGKTSGLGTSVFRSCKQLESVNMPNLSKLGTDGYQFAYCTKLTDVYLPKITSGTYMFSGCSALKKIALGQYKYEHDGYSTNTTSKYAFNNCTSLEAVDWCIGGFTQMEFYNCSKLNTLILRNSSVTTLGNTTNFNGTPFASGKSGGTLYVPEDMIESYLIASNWSTILRYANNNILPIEGSVYEDEYCDGRPIGITLSAEENS